MQGWRNISEGQNLEICVLIFVNLTVNILHYILFMTLLEVDCLYEMRYNSQKQDGIFVCVFLPSRMWPWYKFSIVYPSVHNVLSSVFQIYLPIILMFHQYTITYI